MFEDDEDVEVKRDLKPIGGLSLEKFLSKIKSRADENSKIGWKHLPKTYMQETAQKYLPYINWDNATLENDMRALFVVFSRYYRNHTHAEFVRLLEWVKKKNSLHPKQVLKLFRKRE